MLKSKAVVSRLFPIQSSPSFSRRGRSPKKWYAKWTFATPLAATSEVWERRERYVKTNYPVIWFFQFLAYRKLRRLNYIVTKDWYWWVIHRTLDRYNVVKIRSLKPGYYDTDTRILNSCFDLMAEFAEHKADLTKGNVADVDKIVGILRGFSEETGESQYDELADLYYWWMIERPARDSSLHEDYAIHMTTDQYYQEQDDYMLLRLMKIRNWLW